MLEVTPALKVTPVLTRRAEKKIDVISRTWVPKSTSPVGGASGERGLVDETDSGNDSFDLEDAIKLKNKA